MTSPPSPAAKRCLLLPKHRRSAGPARSVTGSVGRFHPGTVMLSRRARAPVVPAYIAGAFESLPKHGRFPRGRRIRVHFGAPLRFWEKELGAMEEGEAARHLESRVLALKNGMNAGETR